VEIEYVNDATKALDTKGGRPDPSSFYTTGAYKLKANDAIREDFCRWFHSRERNCEGPEWANKYAVGYLFRHLKDLYSGEILITGEPKIKPYDIVYLYDSYNDVSGPVEVEQVTHIFSQETGFVTSIIPDLCVQTNEYASASLIDAVGMYFGALWLWLSQNAEHEHEGEFLRNRRAPCAAPPLGGHYFALSVPLRISGCPPFLRMRGTLRRLIQSRGEYCSPLEADREKLARPLKKILSPFLNEYASTR
jgi:hypothetical protein